MQVKDFLPRELAEAMLKTLQEQPATESESTKSSDVFGILWRSRSSFARCHGSLFVQPSPLPRCPCGLLER